MIKSPTSDVVHQRLLFSTALGNLVFDKTSLHEIDGNKATIGEGMYTSVLVMMVMVMVLVYIVFHVVAVALLAEHNFLALPVYRMETNPVGVASAVENKVYYGTYHRHHHRHTSYCRICEHI